MLQVLIVFPPRSESQKLIEDLIYDDFAAEEPLVTTVSNVAEARRHLTDKRFDILITHLDIPADRTTPNDESQDLGLDLARSLAGEANAPYAILMTTGAIQPDLNAAVRRLDRCELVSDDPKIMYDDMIDTIGRYLQACRPAPTGGAVVKAPPEPEKAVGYVEITIENDRRHGRFRSYSKGTKHPIVADKPFEYKGELMDDVLAIAAWLDDVPDNAAQRGQKWVNMLQVIGRKVRDIVASDADVYSCLQQLASEVDDIENLRLRFVVDRSIHSVPFESLLHWEARRSGQAESKTGVEAADFLMLCAPVYRTIKAERLQMTRARYPLFSDDQPEYQPVNCLIIDAATSGAVLDIKDEQGRTLELAEIKHGSHECTQLRDFLARPDIKEKFGLGEVDMVARNGNDEKFVDQLETKLGAARWDLVHFCGHSYYDDAAKEGYVFVPGKFVTPLPIRKFAKMLHDVRFLYLSSCQSSERGFVYELARHQVPAILGFRWSLPDDRAEDFASEFYHRLFGSQERPRLDYAFFKAQTAMFERCRGERIWAAPMLVMQNVH